MSPVERLRLIKQAAARHRRRIAARKRPRTISHDATTAEGRARAAQVKVEQKREARKLAASLGNCTRCVTKPARPGRRTCGGCA